MNTMTREDINDLMADLYEVNNDQQLEPKKNQVIEVNITNNLYINRYGDGMRYIIR